MVACLLIPGFELRAALRARPRLALVPAALAPEAGEEPLLGPVTAAAEAAGVKPGMRLGEALATCPSLVLVDRDPATVEREWEDVLRRLEDAGFAVDPVEQGAVVFETKGVERLYGGVQPALERALTAVGSTWDPRIGAAGRRFTALAAASVARPGQILLVAATEEEAFLEPLPLSLLPMTPNRYAELEGLGLRSLGELAQLPAARSRSGWGWREEQAWRLAHGGRRARVRGRKPASELVEALTFPEAIANELTLRRALGSLLERLLARPERAGRPFRKLALVARLVDGGSWRRVTTLRDATAEIGTAARGARAEAAGAPGADRRAPSRGGRARGAHGAAARARRAGRERRTSCACAKGCGRCAASTGSGSVCVVEWLVEDSAAVVAGSGSAEALVVPRDELGGTMVPPR